MSEGIGSVTTAVSGYGSGVDGSSSAIAGIADLPYSYSPLMGSLPAFSPRRLPLAHPPGLLQPRKPQPAHWLQPWSGAWHWPARHWRIRRQRARLRHRPGRDCQRPRLPLQRRRRGTDRHLLTRTAARDSMAGDEYATPNPLEQTHTLLRSSKHLAEKNHTSVSDALLVGIFSP